MPFPRSPIPSLALVAATLLLAAHLHDAHADVPDVSQSYFVPEAGSVASPAVGAAATRFFTVCPNNDFLPLLVQNARIKVVLRDANGLPVPGISPADICILFNGGTPAQGYFGVGADSIISNSAWNAAAGCPEVTCIPADAPTDGNGTTYITFAGSTPGSPGVATRDPSRKWGHFDSHIPVYVMGLPIQGRLTTASANGSYLLRIRNLDVVDGVSAKANRGALVNNLDLNAVTNSLSDNSCGLAYWMDFNGIGGFNGLDLNMLLAHLGHGCNTPNSP